MNCVYLVTNKKSGKWYLGSHKSSDNVKNGSYMGSGSEILKAIAEDGKDSFQPRVLFEYSDRSDAYKAEHQLLNAVDAAAQSHSYNQTNNSWPKENFFKRTFGSKKGPLTEDQVQEFVDSFTTVEGEGSKEPSESNDFNFESNLGLFLEKGFDAFAAEGDRQGYDDPSTQNWNKQIQLLKVQLDNNVNREMYIKTNRLSLIESALKATDPIVSRGVEFIMKKKRIENEIEFLKEQHKLVEKEKGWYLMLHEALHDGFQDGAKRKMTELTSSI